MADNPQTTTRYDQINLQDREEVLRYAINLLRDTDLLPEADALLPLYHERKRANAF